MPALFYFYNVYQYACNIPIMDDYDAILNFLHDFNSAGFRDRLLLLFSQHNEHRLLHSRIIYIAYDQLFHNVSFRNLIFIGDGQLLGVAGVSVYFIRKCGGSHWPVIAFVWMLCLFDLNTYESGSIAMYGVQNFGVLMLFFLSMFLYDRGNRCIVPAALLQAICVFSSGNGMIASLFIVVFTLRSGSTRKKIVSAATTLVCSALYFVGYTSPANTSSSSYDIGKSIVYFIRLSGAHFSFDYSLVFGIILLTAVVANFPYKIVWYNTSLWPIICILGFVLTSMGTVSLFRGSIEAAQFQTSRYLIYPQLLVAIGCLFIFLRLEGQKVRLPITIGLLLILLNTWSNNYHFGQAGFRRTAARAEAYLYWYPDRKRAAAIIHTACESDIYCLDEER